MWGWVGQGQWKTKARQAPCENGNERMNETRRRYLCTRSRRLLDDDDDVSGRWLLSNPRVLLEVGMGVGIPLSDSGAVELLRLDKAPGRLRSLGAEVVACSL